MLRFLRGTNIKLIQKDSTRKFTQTSIKNEPKTQQPSSSTLGPHMIKPSEFQKMILVWVKKFPNKAAVPNRISLGLLADAQSRARIKTCYYMTALFVVCMLGAAISGKREARRRDLELD